MISTDTTECVIQAGRLLARPGSASATTDAVITCRGGVIASIDAGSTHPAARTLIAMPALANAHDHLRVYRTVAVGGWDMPFEIWTMFNSGLPRLDPYEAALLALGRSALGGAGSVMVHYTRPQGGMDLAAEAAEVARAAKRIGVRIAFAVSLKDRNALTYGLDDEVLAGLPAEQADAVRAQVRRPWREPRRQIEDVDAVHAACAGALVDVQYGPVGPQWCTDALLEAVAEASARTGRRVHMHLLETPLQRQWADHAHPDGLLRHLDAIGLLSDRLCVAHAVWARPDELDLLAERGVRLASNTSSNLILSSGVAPVGEAVRRGVEVCLGLDGLTLDDDDDALRELRLGYLVHRGVGLERSYEPSDAFHACCATGRSVIAGLPSTARLEAGEPADILVLDGSRLFEDDLTGSMDTATTVLARARKSDIRRLIVAGHDVVRDGALVGCDLAEVEASIRGQMRAGLPEYAAWRTRAEAVAGAIGAMYRRPTWFCG